jgi:hypothetical protein
MKLIMLLILEYSARAYTKPLLRIGWFTPLVGCFLNFNKIYYSYTDYRWDQTDNAVLPERKGYSNSGRAGSDRTITTWPVK